MLMMVILIFYSFFYKVIKSYNIVCSIPVDFIKDIFRGALSRFVINRPRKGERNHRKHTTSTFRQAQVFHQLRDAPVRIYIRIIYLVLIRYDAILVK